MVNKTNKYDWQPVLVITIINVALGWALVDSWVDKSFNLENLLQDFLNKGVFYILFAFFFAFGIYIWIYFLRSFFVKPKEAVLFLDEKNSAAAYFLDDKGNRYDAIFNIGDEYSAKKFYKVLKTGTIVNEVLQEIKEGYETPKANQSYWLNFYSPFINLEAVLVLPIIYLLLFVGIFLIFTLEKYLKLAGLFFVIFPLILIVYDYIYKTKKNKIIEDKTYHNSKDIIDSSELEIVKMQFLKNYNYTVFYGQIIGGIVVLILLLFLATKIPGDYPKIIIIPFLIPSISHMILTILQIISRYKKLLIFEKLNITPKKINIIIFLLFLFSFLIVINYLTVKYSDAANIIYSIPFWLAGFIIIYTKFISRKIK